MSNRPALRYWSPAIVLAVLIFAASTQDFGSTHTSRFIVPVLRWLFPAASAETLRLLHEGVRKSAHLLEYAILSALVFRAWRAGRTGWKLSWSAVAILIVLIYASLDEIHQLFIPGRGAAVRDVAIDTLAGLLAQFAVWLYATRKWPFTSRLSSGPGS